MNSQVRVGRKSRLPELKNLKRQASIARMQYEEDLTKLDGTSNDLIISPEVSWKKNRLKWSEVADFINFVKDPIPKSK